MTRIGRPPLEATTRSRPKQAMRPRKRPAMRDGSSRPMSEGLNQFHTISNNFKDL